MGSHFFTGTQISNVPQRLSIRKHHSNHKHKIIIISFWQQEAGLTMTEMNAQVQTFLKDFDEDVQNYLLQILQDEESYEDPDALVKQLLPFWSNDRKEQVQNWVHNLASQLIRQSGNDSSSSAGNTNTTGNPSASSAMQVIPTGKNGDSEVPSLRSEGGEVDERKPHQDGDNGSNEQEDVEPPSSSSSSSLRLRKSHERRQRREQRRKAKRHGESSCKNDPESSAQKQQQHLLEDQASAWQECLNKGVSWGGRGKGGRGEYAGAVNSMKSNIHLSNISICLDNGTELLHGSTMDIVKGHRYGLIGRNGMWFAYRPCIVSVYIMVLFVDSDSLSLSQPQE